MRKIISIVVVILCFAALLSTLFGCGEKSPQFSSEKEYQESKESVTTVNTKENFGEPKESMTTNNTKENFEELRASLPTVDTYVNKLKEQWGDDVVIEERRDGAVVIDYMGANVIAFINDNDQITNIAVFVDKSQRGIPNPYISLAWDAVIRYSGFLPNGYSTLEDYQDFMNKVNKKTDNSDYIYIESGSLTRNNIEYSYDYLVDDYSSTITFFVKVNLGQDAITDDKDKDQDQDQGNDTTTTEKTAENPITALDPPAPVTDDDEIDYDTAAYSKLEGKEARTFIAGEKAKTYHFSHRIGKIIDITTPGLVNWGDGAKEHVYDGADGLYNVKDKNGKTIKATEIGGSGSAPMFFLELEEPIKLTGYGFVSGNYCESHPNMWLLYGVDADSLDDIDLDNWKEFETIDIVADGSITYDNFKDSTEYLYEVNASKAYKYYVFDFWGSVSGVFNGFRMNELYLYGEYIGQDTVITCDNDDVEITLVGLSENGDFNPWKYKVAEIDYLTDGGITDYIRMGDGGDGFAAFVAANPTWNTANFDDSDWGTHDVPGQLDANVGYDGINHGLFVRAEFELTEDQYDKIKSGDAGLYLFAKYDNNFHVYVNGTQIYADDSSWQFREGKEGSSIAGFKADWYDSAFKVIPVAYDASYENGEEIQGSLTPADILHAGTNVVACSLKDTWGGRLFDADLYYTTDIDW